MKPSPVGERFWKKVHKLSPDGCWIWTGSRFKAGYGMLHSKSYEQPHYAHRLSYEMHVDDLLPSDVVRHRCDNPSCVNPMHLERGSHYDNHRDCVERGRFVPLARRTGVAVHNAALDDERVREIRRLRGEGLSSRLIAGRLGVGQSTVKHVLAGQTWSHVR